MIAFYVQQKTPSRTDGALPDGKEEDKVALAFLHPVPFPFPLLTTSTLRVFILPPPLSSACHAFAVCRLPAAILFPAFTHLCFLLVTAVLLFFPSFFRLCCHLLRLFLSIRFCFVLFSGVERR